MNFSISGPLGFNQKGKGRAWAIAIRRGSCESLVLLRRMGKFSSELGSRKTVQIAMAQVLPL